MTSVRKTVPRDASAVLRLAAAEPLFSREDREVVEELLFDYLEETEPGDYRYLTAIDDGRVVGFACYGPTPLTHGTFDLYWICVSRRQRRRGYGLALNPAGTRAVFWDSINNRISVYQTRNGQILGTIKNVRLE